MFEREWREASDLRTSRFGLAAVLIVGTVLRFWALGHGIPYAVSVDEPEIVERAFHMMKAGTLDPRFYDYGGLPIYLQLLVSVVRFVVGAVTGAWSSLDAAPIDSFYLWGRAVMAALGAATVYLTYAIAARWGARHALLAAALLAVMPLHVRYSHYVLTDTTVTFFVTLAALLSLSAHERGRIGAFAWAGAAAGLAAATKYNGGIAIIMPLIACWMTSPVRPSRLACTLAIAGAAAGAFLLAAPYTVLDLPAFLNAFAHLASEYQKGDPPATPPWVTYLKHLRNTFGWPAALLAGSGLVLGLVRIVRGPGRVRWAVVTLFPLVFFLMIRDQRLIYARYLLPMVPLLCVLAATAVVSGVSLLRRYEIPRAPRTALIAALTMAALLPPAAQAISWNRTAGKTTTVDLAYHWIQANIPPTATIVLESRGLVLPPAAFPKSRTMPQLRHREHETFRAEGVDYLVASSSSYGRFFVAAQDFPREYAEYMRLFGLCRELARFTPSDENPGPEMRILKVVP